MDLTPAAPGNADEVLKFLIPRVVRRLMTVAPAYLFSGVERGSKKYGLVCAAPTYGCLAYRAGFIFWRDGFLTWQYMILTRTTRRRVDPA
jgi:hypothetical protein